MTSTQISACKGQYQIAFLILLLNSWVDIIIILCYQFLLFCSFIKMPLLQDVARPYLLQQWSGKDLDQVGKAKVRITWWLWALFIQNFNNWWNKTIHDLYFNNIHQWKSVILGEVALTLNCSEQHVSRRDPETHAPLPDPPQHVFSLSEYIHVAESYAGFQENSEFLFKLPILIKIAVKTVYPIPKIECTRYNWE